MKGVVAAVRKITEKSIQKYRTFLIAEKKSGASAGWGVSTTNAAQSIDAFGE